MTKPHKNELKEQEELCVFCKKIADEQLGGDVVAFPPLNPVTKGHWLVVPTKHVEDVSEDPQISARAMEVAAEIAKNYDNVNIIISKGEYASQTVKRTLDKQEWYNPYKIIYGVDYDYFGQDYGCVRHSQQELIEENIKILKEIKKLSDGKFGKTIIISGDAQIVLMNLLKIYTLVSSRLSILNTFKSNGGK